MVRQDKGLTAATLDDYFELFAKFVVDPALMSENVDTQREIAQQREAMCKRANVTMHNLSTTTLRTYMNSIGAVYNRTPGVHHKIISSSTMWFPNFNDYFTACSKRNKKVAAVKEAQKDPEAYEVLQDHELPILLQATNMGNAIEAQRWCAMIIGRCSGWRPDSLIAVDVENFSIISEGGKRYLQPVLGSMKTPPATFTNVDKALFKQRIVMESVPMPGFV